ncbi:MAG: tetratricopeptide repeat protein, partial [Planctomycetes bacterium]|nr:tetratricopeptide repeat protein [Planctomycetota bacterium]
MVPGRTGRLARRDAGARAARRAPHGIESLILTAASSQTPDQRRLNDAAAQLAALAAKYPTDPRVRLVQAELQTARARPDAAEKVLREALKDCGSSAEIRVRLARLLANRGQVDQAVSLGEEACRIDPNYLPAWTELASIDQTAGRHAEARAVLQRGIKAVAGEARRRLRRALAVLEIRQGLRKNGLARLRKLADEDPRDAATRG